MKNYLVAFLLFPVSLWAQDIIVRKNGERIKAQVIEISKDEVIYKEWNKKNNLYAIETDEVVRIDFQDGTQELLTTEENVIEPRHENVTEPGMANVTHRPVGLNIGSTASPSKNSWDDFGWMGICYDASFEYADKGYFGMEGHELHAGGSIFGFSMTMKGWYSLATKDWFSSGWTFGIGPNIGFPINDNFIFFSPLYYMYNKMEDESSSGVALIPSIGARLGSKLFFSVGWNISYNFKYSKEDAQSFTINLGLISKF